MTEGRVTYSFFMLRAKSWLMTDAGRALEWHSPQVWSWRAYDEDIRFRYGLIKLILILIKLCIINNNINSCDSCDDYEDSDNCRQFSPKIDWLQSDLDCKHSCGQKPTFVSKRCIECKAEPLLPLLLLLVNKRGNQKFQFLEAPSILSAGMHIV